MAREKIQFENLQVQPHHLWGKQWMLLTCGEFSTGQYNTMAVGWGSLGMMWEKPFAQVVVRPTRFTYGFMEEYESFTLCAFPEEYRKAVLLLGTRSGRQGDKIADSGLRPVASTEIDAPGFEEAELIIECRKFYWDDMEPSRFVDPAIEGNYPEKDYHRIYFGEIKSIHGESRFRIA